MAAMLPHHRETITRYCLMDKFKLHKHEISITFNKDPHIADIENGRFATGLNRVLFVLHSYGHIFTRIKVHIYPNGPSSIASISNYINKYCPNAKQELIFYSIIQKEWDFSFENATKIAFHRFIMRSNDIPFEKLFPRMEQLEMIEPFSFGVLGQHLPQLKTFTLRVSFEADSNADLREFIRLNPQLRSFQMPLTRNNSILCYLNEMIPNLESLIIGKANGVWPYIDVDRSIHFNNVKHFSWGITKANSGIWDTKIRHRFRTMVFDRLESIVIDSDESYAAEIHVADIVDNKKLKMVAIPTCEMRFEYLVRLVQGLPELKVLTIGWSMVNTLPVLERFLSIDMEVEQINIQLVDHTMQLSEEHILRAIPSKWKLIAKQAIDGVEVLSFVQLPEQ